MSEYSIDNTNDNDETKDPGLSNFQQTFSNDIRKLSFDQNNSLALLLNIMGHDVIHDYGSGSSEKRWVNILNLINTYINSYTIDNNLSGGGKAFKSSSSKYPSIFMPIGITKTQLKNKKIIEKTKKNALLANVAKKSLYDEENIASVLNNFIKFYNNNVIFSCFNVYFKKFDLLNKREINIDYLKSNEFLNELLENIFHDDPSENENYDYVLISLKHYFHIYLKSIVILEDNPVVFYNIITDFLNKDYILYTIYDNAVNVKYDEDSKNIDEIYNDNDDDIVVMNNFDSNNTITYHGGARAKDDYLTEESVTQLLNNLTTFKNTKLNPTILDALASLFINYINLDGNNFLEKQRITQEYNILRIDILTELKTILRNYGQTSKAGCIDNASGNSSNNISFIPNLPSRGSRVITDIETYKTKGAELFFKDCLIDYYTEIQSKYFLDQQNIEKKLQKETDRVQQGHLSREQKEFRDDFTSVIAKSALYLNGVCNGNGNLNTQFIPFLQNTSNYSNENYLLYNEILILLDQSGWSIPSGVNINTTGIGKLDEYLYNLTVKQFQEFKKNDVDLVCGSNQKYIIDNAAKLSNILKKRVFCPNTSILDGMSQCSYSTAHYTEECDMNFFIGYDNQTESFGYNGKLTINNDDVNENNKRHLITYNIKIKTATGVIIEPDNRFFQNMDRRQDSKLKAHNVLKVTLQSILELIISKSNEYQDIYSQGTNIFNYLFSKNDPEFFNRLFQILFKGAGDLKQEINAVCKFGGYINLQHYLRSDNIIDWDSTGNGIRMFLANDQPSACRFSNLLMYGKPEEINLFAFGGYAGDNKRFFVSRILKQLIEKGLLRSDEINFKQFICDPQRNINPTLFQGGKNNKKNKTKKGGKITKKKKKLQRKTKKTNKKL